MLQSQKQSEERYHYYNDYGILFEDYFYIDRNNDSRIFYFKNIFKIKFIKQRNLKLNLLFFISGLFCIYIGLFIEELLHVAKIFSLIVSLLFILLSVFHNFFEYKIIVVMNNLNFIKINVNSVDKNEAKEIISKINKKLKSQESVKSYNISKEAK